MSFQIKNFNSIVASIINNITTMSDDLTDFNVGSKTRTLIEAIAREIDQYYQALLKGLHEAIPVAIYKSFNFGRLAATASSGYVRFPRVVGTASDITIPANTKVKIPGSTRVFIAPESTVLLAANSYVDVFVVANFTGTEGNAPANAITELSEPITNIASVTNPNSFTTGTDLETDLERKNRFQKWIKTLARATKASVQYGASLAILTDSNEMITERVEKVLVHEPCIDETPAGDPGFLTVYIWNGITGASASLIADTKKIIDGYTDDAGVKIDGYKGAGVICTVAAVTPAPVNITAALTLETGYTLVGIQTEILAGLDEYFEGLEIGDTVVWVELINIIKSVAGVYDVALSDPAVNVVPTWNHICTRGVTTITEV